MDDGNDAYVTRESVKSLLGKHVKILHKNVVKLETKGDKTDNRVLVFSPCRLFLLTAKVPTRSLAIQIRQEHLARTSTDSDIDSHFHYLEIQAIESKKSNQLILTVADKLYSFLTPEENGTQEVDNMVMALGLAIRNIFPTVPLT
uniref:CARMIL pleckstrin homology domain-containing protein n=1 Tax=Timema cristinae TaxID=61476 RepID=A0A7R9DAJ3_TIMCR|nr:unnamed protein product [Timema cristinae]